MDLDSKISALKDFASLGSSPKNGSSSSRSNQSTQNSNSSSQNGWGNWFAKGEKDPILPSLVSLSSCLNIPVYFGRFFSTRVKLTGFIMSQKMVVVL